MNLTKYKHCSKCDNVFPKETGFYPNKARYDNYDSYCRKCHDKISGKNQNLIQRNDTLKVKKCSICKNVYDLTYFIFQNTYGDGFNNQCKECSSEYQKKRISELRQLFYDKHNNKCKKCGYSENKLAFQIDHVNGDGNIERKINGPNNRNNAKMLKLAILDEENRYQLLCANCNIIKRMEEKEHRKPFEKQIPYSINSQEYLYAISFKNHKDLVPMPDPILGEIRELVINSKAPDSGRFQKGIPSKKRICTDEQIEIIRNKLSQGIKGSVIAKELGVSESIVSRIKKNKTYTI